MAVGDWKKSSEVLKPAHPPLEVNVCNTASCICCQKLLSKMATISSSNHIQAEASNHFFLTHGNGAQPLFPNFSNCDTKSMKMTFASAETPVALQWSSPLVSPLDGASATLQLDGTLANQVKACMDASSSTKCSAKKSTTKLSDGPRSKENLVPSLSTNKIHLLLVKRGNQKRNAMTAASASASKIICFLTYSPSASLAAAFTFSEKKQTSCWKKTTPPIPQGQSTLFLS